MATVVGSKPDILTSTILGRSILAQMNGFIYKLTSGAILASYAEPEKGWKVSRLLDWISLPIRVFVASILISVYGFILLIESTMCCANRGFKTLFVTARKKLYNRLLFCVYSPRDNAAKNIYEVGHCIYKYNAYGARVRFVKMPELEAITDDAKSLLAISCLQGVLAGNMQPCCAKGADLKGEALEANLIALGDYLINNTHDIYYAVVASNFGLVCCMNPTMYRLNISGSDDSLTMAYTIGYCIALKLHRVVNPWPTKV